MPEYVKRIKSSLNKDYQFKTKVDKFDDLTQGVKKKKVVGTTKVLPNNHRNTLFGSADSEELKKDCHVQCAEFILKFIKRYYQISMKYDPFYAEIY